MANAGNYKEQLEIQTPSAVISDGVGGEIATGATSFYVWARVQMQAGSEQLRLGILDAGQPYKITIRYNSSLTTNDKVVWNEVELGISTLVHNEKKTETILYCNVIR